MYKFVIAIGLSVGCASNNNLRPSTVSVEPTPTPNYYRPMSTECYYGDVTRIIDGDTLKIEVSDPESLETIGSTKTTYQTIRLAEIDAPELKQRFGEAAKDFLRKIVNEQIILCVVERDKYGRIIADITHNGLNPSIDMIRRGLAWHYRGKMKKYTPKYGEAEISARRRKINIWSDEFPIPPWEWRRGRRTPKKKFQTKTQYVPTRTPVNYKTPRQKTNYYTRGPRGGCYYHAQSGRKRYVDRSLCN